MTALTVARLATGLHVYPGDRAVSLARRAVRAAETAQTDLVLWLNYPPETFAVIFAVVNPPLRPLQMLAVAAVLIFPVDC